MGKRLIFFFFFGFEGGKIECECMHNQINNDYTNLLKLKQRDSEFEKLIIKVIGESKE